VARKKAPIVRLHTTIDLAPVTNLSSRRWTHELDGMIGSAEDLDGQGTGGAAWPEAGTGAGQSPHLDTESANWR
jgi:hypothetical protein